MLLGGGVASFPVTAHAHTATVRAIRALSLCLAATLHSAVKIRLTAQPTEYGWCKCGKKTAHTYSDVSGHLVHGRRKKGESHPHISSVLRMPFPSTYRAHVVYAKITRLKRNQVLLWLIIRFSSLPMKSRPYAIQICVAWGLFADIHGNRLPCIYLGYVCACGVCCSVPSIHRSRCRHCRACSLCTNPSDTRHGHDVCLPRGLKNSAPHPMRACTSASPV